MATFGALRPPWNPLLHPYRTRVLCPPNLCPYLKFAGNSGGFCGHSRLAPLSQDGRGHGFDKPREQVRLWRSRGGYFMRTQARSHVLVMRLLPEFRVSMVKPHPRRQISTALSERFRPDPKSSPRLRSQRNPYPRSRCHRDRSLKCCPHPLLSADVSCCPSH